MQELEALEFWHPKHLFSVTYTYIIYTSCKQWHPMCGCEWYLKCRGLELGVTNIAGWKMDQVKVYFLLRMGILHCKVSLAGEPKVEVN